VPPTSLLPRPYPLGARRERPNLGRTGRCTSIYSCRAEGRGTVLSAPVFAVLAGVARPRLALFEHAQVQVFGPAQLVMHKLLFDTFVRTN
jgi:hypothetical protein